MLGSIQRIDTVRSYIMQEKSLGRETIARSVGSVHRRPNHCLVFIMCTSKDRRRSFKSKFEIKKNPEISFSNLSNIFFVHACFWHIVSDLKRFSKEFYVGAFSKSFRKALRKHLQKTQNIKKIDRKSQIRLSNFVFVVLLKILMTKFFWHWVCLWYPG